MSTKKWRGDAPSVAQESRATPANVEIGDVFTLTINGKSVSFTATAATVANVTAGLTTNWNALDATFFPEHSEITASDQTTYVKLLADTEGVPFTVTGTSTGNGVPADTLTISTPTANSGPNNWDVAANWSGGAVPVSTDDVVIENSTVSILYGLAQSAVTLTSLTIRDTFTGTIGLPVITSTGYYEYRETYLAIGATTLTLQQAGGTGSGRIKLDTGAVATTADINNTGTPAEVGLEAFLFKGTNAANVLNVNKGSVGVAVMAGEVATVATWRAGYVANQRSDVSLRFGSGCTLTTGHQNGGTVETNAALTTLNKYEGTFTHKSGALTTLNNFGGTCYYQSTGTLGTYNGSGALDFGRDMRARTVTTCNVYKGGTINDPFKTVTWTNGISLQGRRVEDSDGRLAVGTHVKVTPVTL